MKKQLLSLSLAATLSVVGFTGCGSTSTGGGDNAVLETGYFIDSAVEGLEYVTTSGIEGVTDEFGKFNYEEGDKVKFHLGKLSFGECAPTEDGLITPENLIATTPEAIRAGVSEAEFSQEKKVQLLKTLQALDVDGNASNGIEISELAILVVNKNFKDFGIDEFDIRDVGLQDLDLIQLFKDREKNTSPLDATNDGIIDVSDSEALTHYQDSMTAWNEGDLIHPDDASDFAKQELKLGLRDAKQEADKVKDTYNSALAVANDALVALDGLGADATAEARTEAQAKADELIAKVETIKEELKAKIEAKAEVQAEIAEVLLKEAQKEVLEANAVKAEVEGKVAEAEAKAKEALDKIEELKASSVGGEALNTAMEIAEALRAEADKALELKAKADADAEKELAKARAESARKLAAEAKADAEKAKADAEVKIAQALAEGDEDAEEVAIAEKEAADDNLDSIDDREASDIKDAFSGF